MTVQRTRLLLNLLGCGLLLAGAASLVWAVTSPTPAPPLLPAPKAAPRRAADSGSVPAVEQLASVWDRKLRGPLRDPPPPTPPKQEPKPKNRKRNNKDRKKDRAARGGESGIKLLGTVLEQGNSRAIVMDASGAIAVGKVGEALSLTPAGMTVQQIEAERITVTQDGRPLTLNLRPWGTP